MTGALRGSGVLAIWNGVQPGQEREFLRWHVTEHIPERVSVPGFHRARRYVALEGSPAYFNFYEVEDAGVLSSQPYLDRLNDPSDWTQAVVRHFTDTARVLCSVVESRGHGAAGYMVALRLSTPAKALAGLPRELAAMPDISAAHLLAEAEDGAVATAESRMRDRPDETCAAILLIEGADRESLMAAVSEHASDAVLADRTGAAAMRRGLYQLDFMMDRADAVADRNGKTDQ